MSRRGALVYLLVALLLGGAYFFATRQEERKEEQASLARRVFDVQKAAVTGVDVHQAQTPEVRIERAAGEAPAGGGAARPAWRITSPKQVPADPGAVNAVIDAALAAEKRRTLEGDDLDPAEYGLDRPSLRVSLRTGGDARTIELGAESITGDARYARLAGSPAIFLVPAATYNQMDLGLEGLRDRRLMPLDRDAIGGITVAWDDARVELRKESGGWKFAKRERPVSDTAVDGLIATVSESNVDRFVTDEEVAPEAHGLDAPDAMVTFEGKDRRWIARFKRAPAGEEDAQAPVLAARSTAPGVVALPATFLDRLPRSAADLEDQILLRADADAITAITLRSGEREARFEKAGDDWARETPAPAGEEPESPPDAAGLLDLLSDLRHDGSPPHGSALSGEPELSLRLSRQDGGVVLDLLIGPALEGDGAHPGRLIDDAGERDVLLSRFTMENLRDRIGALAPGLLPESAPRENAPPEAAAP